MEEADSPIEEANDAITISPAQLQVSLAGYAPIPLVHDPILASIR